MYEESWVPERTPGGGGFSIKNISLKSLYIENTMGHNIFTKANTHYPLMRYNGCKLKFYQSQDIDYVCTYSISLPLRSNLKMYNSMQPSIHLLQKQKIIVPSKLTQRRRKPYIIKYIQPPTQMQNNWYFQSKLANTPLLQLRTTACSLDHYYIGSRQQSTNITITTLNTNLIQNRRWGDRNYTYSCRNLGTVSYFLYAAHTETETEANVKVEDLVTLTNTQDYQAGMSWREVKTKNINWQTYYQQTIYKGNPFHSEYLLRSTKVIITTLSPTQLYEKYKENGPDSSKTLKDFTDHTFQFMEVTIDVRYNPYKDYGTHNQAYFLEIATQQHGWDPPGVEDLRNYDLPLWIIFFGFPDFVKKTAIIHHVDTNYIVAINTTKTEPQIHTLVPLSATFEYGISPYIEITEDTANKPNPIDAKKWYPQYQHQQEILNTICLTGPGTPKISKGTTVECKIKYCFYFKWGGDLPPMSTMEDPTDKPTYPIPGNIRTTNSLQNPESAPETYLYDFDERRGQLTQKATKRMQKDWGPKEMPFLSTEPRFSETPTIQDPQEETSSEEEEETNLFDLLNQQRAKQLRLKQRIMKTIRQLQNLQ